MFRLFALFLSLISLCSQAAELNIVASIKPVQLLVSAISGERQSVKLLIPASSSPHDFQLRPSERRMLAEADLLFWISPEMEMPLARLEKQLTQTRSIRLYREPNEPEKDTHDDHHDTHEDHHDHDHESQQTADESHHHQHSEGLHIWLNPDQSEALAHRITQALIQADPINHDYYQANLALFIKQLKALDQRLQQQLAPVQQQGYFVFHDAYQGFEQHYRLNHLGAFTLNPERRPGAQQLSKIQHQLAQKQASCVFSEPQFDNALLDNLIADSGVSKAQLDPLGQQIEVSSQGYFQLLQQLADSFSNCLSKKI